MLSAYLAGLHSPTLTWSLKRTPAKSTAVQKGALVRLHVSFPKCSFLFFAAPGSAAAIMAQFRNVHLKSHLRSLFDGDYTLNAPYPYLIQGLVLH